jgi:hypothetical protein
MQPVDAPHRHAGQLTFGWSNVLAIAWSGVCVGLGVVAIASRRLGLSVWWLGTETSPAPVYLTVLPFVMPVVAVMWALSGRRRAPLMGLAAAVATGAVAVGDIDRVPGLAATEALLALGGAIVSLAAMSGVLRPASPN